MTDKLKLLALDDADLTVVSAHVQDSVLKANDIQWLPDEGKLAMSLNRFAWEAKGNRRLLFKKYERRKAALHVDRVLNVRTKGLQFNSPSQVLSLLAVQFWPSGQVGDPAGTVEFSFADNIAIEAGVECVEARLTDLDAAWSTNARPRHNNSAM